MSRKPARKEKVNHRLASPDTRGVPGEITSGCVAREMEVFVRGLAESRNLATSELGVHPRRL